MHGIVGLPEQAVYDNCNYSVLRNTRKKLSKKPLVRKSIKTASRYDLQRGKKRREMIAASKKRKSTHT